MGRTAASRWKRPSHTAKPMLAPAVPSIASKKPAINNFMAAPAGRVLTDSTESHRAPRAPFARFHPRAWLPPDSGPGPWRWIAAGLDLPMPWGQNGTVLNKNEGDGVARRMLPGEAKPMAINLKVNGASHSVPAEPDTPLLYVLRNDLALNGAKFGCGLAQCGACTVLVDGKPVQSCITPIGSLGSAEITTIEGLGTPDKPHALQK